MTLLLGADLMGLLPHRPPTLCVDSVAIAHDENEATGIKCFSMSEPCYWQTEPTSGMAVPRSLLIESLGQTAAALWLWRRRARSESNDGTLFFAKAEGILFSADVEPGSVVEHHIWFEREIGGTAFMRGESVSSNNLVLSASTFVAAIR